MELPNETTKIEESGLMESKLEKHFHSIIGWRTELSSDRRSESEQCWRMFAFEFSINNQIGYPEFEIQTARFSNCGSDCNSESTFSCSLRLHLNESAGGCLRRQLGRAVG